VSSNANTPVRLGVIGAGRWGRNYIKTIRALPTMHLSALASRNPASKDLVDSSCRVTPDWQELLNPQLLDGVIIATPPNLHAEMLEAAIRARLPAMIEKPLTLNLSDAVKLDSLQREFKALVLVDHTRLFNSAFIELNRRAQDLGQIRSIHSESGNWGPFRDYTALWDWGPHDLSVVLTLLRQSPSTIRIEELERRHVENTLAGNYQIELGFRNDVRASIKLGNLFEQKTLRLTVVLERGTLVFDDLAANRLIRRDDKTGGTTVVELDNKLPLTRAVETFVRGIRGEASEFFGLDLAVEIARVLDHGSNR
jgi:predicted dehydrogenase